MKNGTCSWCKEDIANQDFTKHSNEHLRDHIDVMSKPNAVSTTSVSNVSYWTEKDIK